MFTRSRLIAAAAVATALATAGPVAGASAAQPGAIVSSGTSATSNIPCYPLPAFCGSDGQPAWWAPRWVRPALGLPPLPPLLPLPSLRSLPPLRILPLA
jgi:hypothetical protein